MSLETVVIGTGLYYIHQLMPEYGVDDFGNPHYLGKDYSLEELEVLVQQRDEDDKIFYSHGEISYPEDVFIALCRIPLIPNMQPVAVLHADGDDNNNDVENLRWVYA
jgi:hypothetical protein